MQKEISKFLKRIHAEKLKNNHKECIELYNIVGGLYSEIGSYEEAIHYHELAKDTCKTIGDRLGTAISLRYVGEAKASLGQFYQGIDCIKKYLELAQKINNKVEIQRAWTTLGRIYLMQAQDLKDATGIVNEQVKNAATEAEKRFQTALNLAESVRDQVDEKEFVQMKSGLLINIGLVKDICGEHQESVSKLMRAADLCKGSKLKEELYRCQIILAGIFRQRNNVKYASKVVEEALVTAKQIGKKILICEALIERGLVKICQRDFKNAKRTFAQAYLEKSPNEDDHTKAIKLTKLSHLINVTYDKLSRDNTPSETRMKLCDKLGDLFVAINAYKLAIEFYKRAFTDAKVCSKPKHELARILFSVAETYADDGQYEHALVCYEKELTYREGNDKEQCQSWIKIAHMHEYLNHESGKVCQSYEKALLKADKDPKLKYNVLKYYTTYMKKKTPDSLKYLELNNTLLNLKSYPEVIDDIEAEGEEEANDLEDEIANIEDIITDDEDNDEVLMVGRRRTKGARKFKPNEVGDTPLHEACIKGDLKRVQSLINQGHEVNPRDNAGWIPLHEASNHGHYKIVEYLLENGADVSNRGLKGMSPLHDAATNGHYDIMRLLIRSGANVIALTDTGETVLSCLRDFKKRNYSQMSNQEQAEYKQMEAELLNIMDKCGFNLMEENMKNLGNRGVSSSNSSAVILEQVKPRPRSDRPEPISNPVRDYRDVIGILKRKRAPDEPKEIVEKSNLPATYKTGSNTSAPTKEWLVDDITKPNQTIRRLNPADLVEFDEEFSENEAELTVGRSPSSPPPLKSRKQCKDRSDTKRAILNSDDEDDDEEVIIVEPKRAQKELEMDCDFQDTVQDVDFEQMISPQAVLERSSSSFNFSTSNQSVKPFSLFNDPLVVKIEDQKLLVPVKEDDTIRSLKDSIIERYSSIVNAKPNISLVPSSEPTCFFFDKDLCRDVIRESVVAIVDSWQLNSLEESYVEYCSRIHLDPLTFIRVELRRIESGFGNKSDMSFTRFPNSHVSAIVSALARRDFMNIDLTGSISLFEEARNNEMMNTILTWRKLTHLTLSCVGLKRSHFETICNSTKSSMLKSLDVSYNVIVYKFKKEFKKDIESLRKTCTKLKRLNVRKNSLQFQKTNPKPSDWSNEQQILEAESRVSNEESADLVLLKPGETFELFGMDDQNEYSVYAA